MCEALERIYAEKFDEKYQKLLREKDTVIEEKDNVIEKKDAYILELEKMLAILNDKWCSEK